ncbi:MAG: prolipoprotein diacylglyceryl transferase [Christensenella sp.]
MIDRIAIHNLFGISGLDIAWYGILIACGIVAGVALAVHEAKRRGYTAELLVDFMILALPLAIIGARLYYVAFEWGYYSEHPEEIIAVWNGGIAIYGAIIGGVIAAIILSKWRKFPLGRLLDVCAPGLILGQAIGRWGNFVNQEAFGQIVTNPNLQFFPYAVFISERDTGTEMIINQWVQATFFYESMWDIAMMVLLLFYARRAKHDGNVFAMYLIGYGIGRFWIEGLRVSTLQVGGIAVSQLLSLVLIAVGLIYILVMRKKNKANVLYEGRYCKDFKKTEA